MEGNGNDQQKTNARISKESYHESLQESNDKDEVWLLFWTNPALIIGIFSEEVYAEEYCKKYPDPRAYFFRKIVKLTVDQLKPEFIECDKCKFELEGCRSPRTEDAPNRDNGCNIGMPKD